LNLFDVTIRIAIPIFTDIDVKWQVGVTFFHAIEAFITRNALGKWRSYLDRRYRSRRDMGWFQHSRIQMSSNSVTRPPFPASLYILLDLIFLVKWAHLWYLSYIWHACGHF